MFTTRLDQITNILRVIRTADGNIKTSALVSADGLVIASDHPEQIGDDRVSAKSAAMLSLGEKISIAPDRDELDQVIVSGKKGLVMLNAVGSEAVLTTLV
jgi:predicted regulator of Ras-like GTPase activity (Roadblock/LC7/MglB family)